MPKPTLALILSLVALVSFSTPTLAQTTAASITINTGSQATQLVDQNGNAVTHGYTSDHPFWVNLQECRAGWQYQVSVTTVGTGTANMEVWASTAGNDCASTAARFTTASCWRVGYFGVNEGTYAYYIPVQNVVAMHYFGLGEASGTTVHQGTAEDCDKIARQTNARAGVSITLYFYIFSGAGTGTPTYSATWAESGYDLIGPSAPATVGARAADTQLYLNWSQVLDSDLAGYRVYCQECRAAGDLDVCDSYSTGDAGEFDCSSDVDNLVPGCLPPSEHLKGTVSDKLAVSGIAGNLTNGREYACGVAGFDTRQNSGTLSELVTGSPWWVRDFYTAYREAKGKGGGGFCSVGQRPSGFGLLIPLASLGLLALRRWRSSTQRSRTSA